MTETNGSLETAELATNDEVAPPIDTTKDHRARWWSPRKIGAIYLWIAIIVLFGIIEPDLFLSDQTVKGIANSYAITGIAALAVLVPLVAGVFDVSVGATMTLTGIVVAKLLSETSLPIWVIVLLGLGCGLVVGLMNSIVVVVLRIPSLIGTLAIPGDRRSDRRRRVRQPDHQFDAPLG